MKKVIELLELLRSLYYILTKCEIELAAKDVEQAEKTVKEIDAAIAELKAPRWETPEQWKKRTGKPWPDNWAVYTLYKDEYSSQRWWFCQSYNFAKTAKIMGHSVLAIVCATEAGPPPDDWRPEETGNDV
jgi:hypothetical protein